MLLQIEMYCCLATARKSSNKHRKMEEKIIITHSKGKTHLIPCSSLPYIVIRCEKNPMYSCCSSPSVKWRKYLFPFILCLVCISFKILRTGLKCLYILVVCRVLVCSIKSMSLSSLGELLWPPLCSVFQKLVSDCQFSHVVSFSLLYSVAQILTWPCCALQFFHIPFVCEEKETCTSSPIRATSYCLHPHSQMWTL